MIVHEVGDHHIRSRFVVVYSVVESLNAAVIGKHGSLEISAYTLNKLVSGGNVVNTGREDDYSVQQVKIYKVVYGVLRSVELLVSGHHQR